HSVFLVCNFLHFYFTTNTPTVRCSVLPPQQYFIRKATACQHSFIPICADSEAVGMVIVINELVSIERA
ncbi:MAG: hypothetical protein LUB63_05825, partial [Oscillospiraceae bacterium]|nr:hypothetical protein [Oscillospiraceae bacterium]